MWHAQSGSTEIKLFIDVTYIIKVSDLSDSDIVLILKESEDDEFCQQMKTTGSKRPRRHDPITS